VTENRKAQVYLWVTPKRGLPMVILLVEIFVVGVGLGWMVLQPLKIF